MRFLTKEWHGGELSEAESDAAELAFLTHREQVLLQLPARLQEFVREISIHDALVRSVRLDRHEATLELNLRAGDLQRGYFDLRIAYDDVDLALLDATALRAIADNPTAEALYDEVDVAVASVQYEHRWLWWPYEEIAIRFASMAFMVTPRSDREFVRDSEPFVEIGAPAG